MASKPKIAVMAGGPSAEHEISLQSARYLVSTLQQAGYQVELIGILRSGEWLRCPFQSAAELDRICSQELSNEPAFEALTLQPGQGRASILIAHSGASLDIDLVLPITHGPMGEDGKLQSLLEVLDLPYVGANPAGSLIGMDKILMKQILRDSNLPIADFIQHHKADTALSFDHVAKQLGTPFFVKPANMGSSVGIHRIEQPSQFEAAVADAFLFDDYILFEEGIDGREIEVAVLGGKHPKLTSPGEIIPTREFYDLKAKYDDPQGTTFRIPAPLEQSVAKQIEEIALKTFQALRCHGMARVDFFVQKNGKVLVNEINTLPGFTSISLYPRLWQESGVKVSDVLAELFELALEKQRAQKALQLLPVKAADNVSATKQPRVTSPAQAAT